MSIDNMDKIFKPKSIAVIGASERESSVGSAVFSNLINGGYSGNIYPVNPKHNKIFKKRSFSSVIDIKEQVDLAILATPIAAIPEIITECVKAKVGGAIIVSAGGKETGIEGKRLEDTIKHAAGQSGLRIIGPNCLGIICSSSKLNASFGNHTPLPGKMAFISQSGAICTSILDLSIKENIGFSYFVSLGSMLDIEFGDMIDYLGGDPEVSSIVMYVESLSRFRNFMSAARSVSRVKPIIALKSGRTQAGTRAAASHTGALTGEDAVYEAAFKRAGIVRVKTFEELFDCAELLAKQPRPSGPGLAIITNAGGPGVMAADALCDYGAEPVSLSKETIQKLDEILPSHWSRANPVDILGDATPERYHAATEICLKAPEVNGLLIILSPVAMTNPSIVAESLTNLLAKKSLPVFTSWMGGADVEKGRDIFNQAGIPTFDTPERAVRAFMDLYRYSRNKELLQEIPPKLQRRLEFDQEEVSTLIHETLNSGASFLSETGAKRILSAYGIPVNKMELAINEKEARQKAKEIGLPVAMKINSRDILHKTDAKGVKLDLENDFEVTEAFNEIIANATSYNPEAKIEGVTIQTMMERPDYELIIGAKKDRDFGPILLFGMGGIMTEVIRDKSIALPPLNRLLARRLMEETNVYQLLKGFRGRPPANLELIEEILIRLSQLVCDFPEIVELDINPLMVTKNDACAVDARIILKSSEVKTPHHMVISPYPNQYEDHAVAKNGKEFFIRPIRPEDAPLLVAFFEELSPRTVHLRFFSALKHLPHWLLARFTQIDYDRSMALVALSQTGDEEKMLGVARVISENNLRNAEFAVCTEDKWQGEGIGAELLKRCLDIAQERGIEKVYGTVLGENTQMLALGKKLGFEKKIVPQSNEYELSLEFPQFHPHVLNA